MKSTNVDYLDQGIVKIGTCSSGDILVGKITPIDQNH
jgi:DNA-directed RNA polymerase beta subunit